VLAAEFLRAADATKLNLPVFGGDALATSTTGQLLKNNPGLLRNVTVTAFSQGSDAFKRKFAAAAPGVTYHGSAAQGYDAMDVLLRAYVAASAPKDPSDIAKQITKQNFTGAYAYLN
jgi:ABC-type branched-subunit amino acid transport system substrate-binding protein